MSQVCSIFSQLLQLFPRAEFEQAVRQHRGERHARGFTCWGQFVAMLFCQLGRAQSLREICGGLAANEGKLRHLGLSAAPLRSTLAYANRQRPYPSLQSLLHRELQVLPVLQGQVNPAKASGLGGPKFGRNPGDSDDLASVSGVNIERAAEGDVSRNGLRSRYADRMAIVRARPSEESR